MEAMDLSTSSISPLKRRLDLLARMISDRGSKRHAIQHLYLNPQVRDRQCGLNVAFSEACSAGEV